MAAVSIGTLKPVTVTAYEVNDKGQAAVDLVRGTLVVQTAATPGSGFEVVWDKAATTVTDPAGIVLMDCKAGGTVAVGIHGEMDGYTGLTPGSFVYPSGSVAGGIDTTKPSGAIERMRAASTTRIRFCFV
jgi:hypothetical protein